MTKDRRPKPLGHSPPSRSNLLNTPSTTMSQQQLPPLGHAISGAIGASFSNSIVYPVSRFPQSRLIPARSNRNPSSDPTTHKKHHRRRHLHLLYRCNPENPCFRRCFRFLRWMDTRYYRQHVEYFLLPLCLPIPS